MRLAEAVSPFPASFEVTALVVLVCVLEVVPVTLIANEHDAPGASVAPESWMLLDPAVAVMVPPPQVAVKPFGVETIWPAGRLSVKPIPLRERPVFGFDKLKVRVVLPFNGTLADPNAFEIVGGSFAGGGGELLDDPPPHPILPRKLRRATSNAKFEAEGVRRLTGAHLLLSMTGSFLICQLIQLRLRLSVHLVIEFFHSILCGFDLLK